MAERKADSERLNAPSTRDQTVGDFGPGTDELLIDGQEEVFSRSEVERHCPEHGAKAGGDSELDAGNDPDAG